MKVQETKIQEFVFDAHEAKKLMDALDYVSHRQNKHKKAKHLDSNFIEHTREWLRQVNRNNPFDYEGE